MSSIRRTPSLLVSSPPAASLARSLTHPTRPPMACSLSSSIFTPFPTRTRLHFKPTPPLRPTRISFPPLRPTRIRIRSVQTVGSDPDPIPKFLKREYKCGFSSESESFSFLEGISESTVRSISALNSEPDWMLRFRLAGLNRFLSMPEPKLPDIVLPPIDLNSLELVDPRLLGISLSEEERLATVDSTSIATIYRGTLLKAGVIFCSISEAIREYPALVSKYLGKVVSPGDGDNYYAALNSAVFSDGSFCYVPMNTVSPEGLCSYLMFNGKEARQFKKRAAHPGMIIISCARRWWSCIVRLGAEITYSTVQDLYRGDDEGKYGIYNFVTKRGICDGPRSKISWTQVETGSAITSTSTSVVLKGDDTVGEFYSVALTKDYQQADTGTKMIHVGKNSRSKIISKGISAGKSINCFSWLLQVGPQAENARNFSHCDSILIGDTAVANTYPDIQVMNPTALVEREATTALKFGEEQLRGIDHKKAVIATIAGLCRDAFEKLPLGFASEVNRLINWQLEECL